MSAIAPPPVALGPETQNIDKAIGGVRAQVATPKSSVLISAVASIVAVGAIVATAVIVTQSRRKEAWYRLFV